MVRRPALERGARLRARKLVRRAVRYGRLLGRTEPFLAETAAVVIDTMGEAYPHLIERRDEIIAALHREEAQFARTLDAGTVQLEEALLPLSTTERMDSGPPTTCPPTRRSFRATSRSGSTTRTAFRSI